MIMAQIILNIIYYIVMAFSSFCMYAGSCVIFTKNPDAKTRENAIATFMFGGLIAVVALFIKSVAG